MAFLGNTLMLVATAVEDLPVDGLVAGQGALVAGTLYTWTGTEWQAATAPAGAAFPVGAVFVAVVATSPATLLGYGTWAQIAEGRMLVGQDAGDPDFDVAEETGGAKTHALTAAEMPAHVHGEQAPSSASGGAMKFGIDTNASGTQAAGIDTASAGGGGAHSILNPYFVVYLWKRTA